MFDLQTFINALGAEAQLRRIQSDTILTLGDLIDELRKHNREARVVVSVVATDETPDGTPIVWEHSGERHHRWYEPGLYPAGPVRSYRGYYSDLAIDLEPYKENPDYDESIKYAWDEPRSHKRVKMTPEDVVTVGTVLDDLVDADGKTFEGYKGGDNTMSRHTPVWVSNYGDAAGLAVSGVEVLDGVVVIMTALYDD